MRVVLVLAAAAVVALLLWLRDDAGRRGGTDRTGAEAETVRRDAVAEDPAPQAEPEPEWEPPPPDPVERGECSLFVQLLDDRTGAPCASRVHLWRLNAPGNENWSAGDQRQAAASVPARGHLFKDLPEGEHRLFVLGEYFAAEPAPAFGVAGPRTEIVVPIRLPEKHPSFLRVFTGAGAPVTRGELRRYGPSRTTRRTTPEWARRRLQLRGGLGAIGLGGGAGGGVHVYRNAAAGARGFDLGEVSQDDREWSCSHSWSLSVDGWSKVRARVDQKMTGERTYLGLTVPLETLHALVFLPDGGRAIDAGASFRATCDAVLETPESGREAWQGLPVTVNVTLDGYKKLKFEYRLGGPNPPRYLIPAQ